MDIDHLASSSLPYSQLIDSYPHLRAPGSIPTPNDRISIDASRKLWETRLAALHLEIAQLKNRTLRAEAELNSVQQHIDAHANLTSPLRRIPAEIMCKIFSDVRPLVPLGLADMTLAAPWTLLRVCRHWREVCLMFGSLWSSICIEASANGCFLEHPSLRDPSGQPEFATGSGLPVMFNPNLSLERACALLELQLERSRDADLSIVIEQRNTSDYAQPFLRILLPHLHRCIHLMAPYHILKDTPLRAHVSDRLTHVYMDHRLVDRDYDQGRNDFSSHLQALIMHPTVAYVASLNQHGHRSLERPSYPPELLSKLNLRLSCGDSPEDLSTLLSPFQKLTELQLSSTSGLPPSVRRNSKSGNQAPYSLLDLPRLRVLVIGVGAEVPPIFIQSIRAPRLTDLTYGGTIVPQVITNLLSHSNATLRRFCLNVTDDNEYIPEGFFDQVFVKHPGLWRSLETIVVAFDKYKSRRFANEEDTQMQRNDHAASAFFRLLTCSSDSEDVFPALLELELSMITPSISQVTDMLESRRLSHGGARLLRCKLAGLKSEHLLFDPSRVAHESKAVESAAQRSMLLMDSMQSSWTLSPWDIANPVKRYTHEVRTTGTHGKVAVNRRLWWWEGLEREPEQWARIRRLEKEGLELCMKDGWVSEVENGGE